MDNLGVIITGFENSGTTLMERLIRNCPTLDCGFECGVLLADTPQEFHTVQHFYDALINGWDIDLQDREFMCDTDSFDEFYERLRTRSRRIQNKEVQLIDKTPRYMEFLPEVLKRIPNVPCVVVVKDPRSMFNSWGKRWDVTLPEEENRDRVIRTLLKEMVTHYLRYSQGVFEALTTSEGHRIYIVQMEAFTEDPVTQLRGVFNFIGVPFQEKYAQIGSNPHVQSGPVQGNQVMTSRHKEYQRVLTPELQKLILRATKKFSDLHWQ